MDDTKLPRLVHSRRKASKSRRRREPAPMRCPEHLTGEAGVEWRRIAGDMQAMGLLDSGSRPVFELYCTMWAQFVAAQAEVQRHGMVTTAADGSETPSPQLEALHQVSDLLLQLFDSLGLTPLSRARIRATRDDGCG